MSKVGAVAFYARVSSDAQVRDHTIDSQVAALRERIGADGLQIEPDHGYVDDGRSGANLQRPGLEKLRDAVAGGQIERVYVHAPDRLARSHAHQVLLIEEFRRAGTAVVFLNRTIGDTAEDNLLLQVQGIIAEYERAKILERVRRGRLHAARSGLVSALTGAPFGYRYICRDQGGGVARFEVVEDEADLVRRVFAWVGIDRLSLREVSRRLQQMGCKSRRGLARWGGTAIRDMLTNPAYIGRAALGRSRVVSAEPRLRSTRRNSRAVPSATRRVRGPREEWVEIAVPALVDPAVFEAAQAQLDENRKRKRGSLRGPRWLLQGLTVCRCCGYAYYAKTSALSPTDRSKGTRHYYRCIGADAYRLNGAAKCSNPTVRGDRLEQMVWNQVRELLQDPGRVADEFRRRLGQVRDGAGPPEQVVRLDRQIMTLRRGIDRLIDCYAGGFIDKGQFEPRIAGLKLRLSLLQERQQVVAEASNAERELSLVISRLQEFSAKVSQGLDRLDWHGMRQIIHTVVRRIEIDHESVEVIFRVPPPGGSPAGQPPPPSPGSAQHCTDGYARLRRAIGAPLRIAWSHFVNRVSAEPACFVPQFIRCKWLKDLSGSQTEPRGNNRGGGCPCAAFLLFHSPSS
jgi:site-specific DNA recombinase